MEKFGLTMIIVSLFWFIVGGVSPFFVKGPNRELIRVMLVLTAVCCYTFWLCCILHQYKPLIGPQVTNETARALNYLWGRAF